MRILSKEKYNAHTEPLFKTNKLLKLEDIHTANKLKFFYKLENGLLPPYFWTYMFTANTTVTRNRDPYQQLVPRTATFSESIRFSLPCLLKNTPPLIKNKVQTHSMDGFKNYTKNALLAKYSTECTMNNCYICKRP